MKFGHFDDKKREYCINTPLTPYPWINYLGTERFFSLMSHTAGGYSFYRDARLRRLTRYRYNNVPTDNGGKYFYISEGTDFWSPSWMPVKKDLDSYECRHGMGYTVITGAKGGIEVERLSFVPLNYDGELTRIKISNKSDRTRKLSLFSFVEFCFYNALDDMTNFQRNFSTGEVEVKDSVIYHKTEYRERRNHYTFFSVNQPLAGFDTDRDTFLGPYGGLESPAVVVKGHAANSVASGWSPVGSHHLEVELAAGEEKSFIFILGYATNPQEQKWEAMNVVNKTPAKAMIKAFDTDAKVDAGFAALKAYWDDLLGRYQLESSEEKLNRMVNVWNPYQCMITFNLSRSASYFESGIGRGMGFRDSNQDILGFVHQAPERSRERLIDLASTMLEDGGAYHQYQPLTKKGNAELGGGFNDDPLWMIAAVAAYIKETGDMGILDEQVPFNCNENNTATMFEHLKRAFYHVVNNRGPHGLPLIGRADWNDCLNLNCFSNVPDESFQTVENREGGVAESVLIAGMFAAIGPDFVALCQKRNDKAEGEAAQQHLNNMEKTVLEHGYDGDWFLRAYDAEGRKVGSSENEEGKIFIESQGYCVMGGIGVKTGEALKALDSVKKYLDTDYGIVLQQPAYSRYYDYLGEISSYPPGYKENAGIFCHNNPWIMIAETVMGRGDRAFEVYRKIAPSYLEDVSDIHKTEPYVYSQMVAGKDACNHGQAKNAFLTGTAAWNFVAISQYILGIRADYDGLCVDPCIPKAWKNYTVTRRFRGATYKIEVKNPNGVSKGIKSLTLDGKKIEGQILPVLNDGKTHCVIAEMG